MKTIIFLSLFLNSLFGTELNWLHNYNEALNLAKKEHKDIYLFIGADECPYCKKFKDKTLSKKNVINKNFIPLYLSRNQHKIPKEFEKYGVPRHYFLSDTGEVFDEDLGFLNSEDFLKFLKEVREYRE